jgi:multiple sugar transport system ATP-binding protein
MAEVAFEHVAKRYGDQVVIEDFDLAVRAHELMVLLGPSGCGKSTLLRIVAGLDTPSAGRVRIGGRDVTALPPRDRDVAMVFQSYALYPHMTVRQNLAFGLEMRGTPGADRDRLVAEAAGALGLTDLLDRTPRQLSGGQRQRVAVGRAIVRKPAVFLFDEPLSNLDARLRVQTRGEIARLQRDLATTTIYVTHDQVEAMTLGHRIAVLDAGRLQQCGPPLELYERPANRFVAGFIGAPPMNFLTGLVEAGAVVGPGFRVPLPPADRPGPRPPPAAGDRVAIGVRPEHLHLTGSAEVGTTIEARGEVELVEPLGAETIVYVRVGDVRVAARAAAGPHAAPGAAVILRADPRHAHVFGAASGARWA